MSQKVITDRAEAMFLARDEVGEVPHAPKPIRQSLTAPPEPSGDRIICSWCGAFSAPGPGCDSCGSPVV